MLLAVLAGISLVSRVRTRRRYYARLREHSLKVVNLEEKECTRLAHDLHDSILPRLAMIRLQLRKGRQLNDLSLHEEAEANLLRTIDELRSVVRNLVPHNLKEKGLEVVLQELFQQYHGLYPAQINFQFKVKSPAPAGFELHLYRLVQEAVYNALVHSGATVINVSIRQSHPYLTLLCSDNGCGLPAESRKGLGLSSLNLRTQVLNGHLEVRSRPGEGTTYFFNFPYFLQHGTTYHYDC
ncbi:MAG TPA: ATP-binding protein [Flavisolibacter sp.]|nr:ATP-binding protein [Flavisolibacter sp.]